MVYINDTFITDDEYKAKVNGALEAARNKQKLFKRVVYSDNSELRQELCALAAISDDQEFECSEELMEAIRILDEIEKARDFIEGIDEYLEDTGYDSFIGYIKELELACEEASDIPEIYEIYKKLINCNVVQAAITKYKRRAVCKKR